jgi:type II secretory pathway pseudopilin PulG
MRAGTLQSNSRGISLLEVLIAMFILSVGLLGLAALLPVGQADIVAAGKSDRSAAAGRLAMRDLRARGILCVDNWMNHYDDPAFNYSDDPYPSQSKDGSGNYMPGAPQQLWSDLDYNADPNTPGPQLPTPLDLGNSLCIDPLFITRNLLASQQSGNPSLPPQWQGRAFPYFLDNAGDADVAVYQGLTLPPPRMTRANLRAWRWANAPQLPVVPSMTYPVAERIFMIQDDRLFDQPTDATIRSQPIFGTGKRQESAGDYSWMATIVPLPGSDTLLTALTPIAARRRCEVSVAVFYKRNLILPSTTMAPNTWAVADRVGAPPSERVVLADMLSGGIGWGGGDVRLRLPGSTAATGTPAERSDMPRVRPNTWILLAGWTLEGNSGSLPPMGASITAASGCMSQAAAQQFQNLYSVPPPGLYGATFPNQPPLNPPLPGLVSRRAVFQWYRVITASAPTLYSAGASSEWQVDVTLAGPDWNPVVSVGGTPAIQFQDVDGPANGLNGPPTSYAILLENCIGVYTRTLEVNGTNGWQ